uniref:Uncharacterized protein n=1 Tax=Timema poppense TaxID=170557 RepID=A0A7R9DXE1_TIMPO|nr:unnamed protein product [Timema poppensis]
MPGCCSQVGLRAVVKAGLVAATRWFWLLLKANARLLLSGGAEGNGQGGVGLRAVVKAGMVAATKWGWLLLPANARLLLSGGADGNGQGGAGGSD